MTTQEHQSPASHHLTMEEKLNAVRAGVLGSNDGILTVVGVLFSVAAVTTDQFTLFIAGLADLLACAFSMAAGEYASVSSQTDSEKAVVAIEKRELAAHAARSEAAIRDFYHERGVSVATAAAIAQDLMAKKPLETVLSVKHDVTLGHYVNPWQAAWSSLGSAALGGLFPLVALLVTPRAYQFLATILATAVAVALTGYLSARLSNGLVKKAVVRNVVIGLATIAIHYGVGRFF